MIAPASKSKELIGQFMLILDSGRTFQGAEELQYRRELKHFPENELEGAQLRAFYNACNGNTDKAIEFFKKSLGFNQVGFIVNYLVYLIKLGRIKDYISETQKAHRQLPHNPNLLNELFRSYTLSGDVAGLLSVLSKFKMLAIDELDFYESFITSLDDFMNGLGLSQNDVMFIANTLVDIADENRIEIYNVSFEYEDEMYSVSLPTSYKNVKHLAQMNRELADRIATNDSLAGKVFAPIIYHHISHR